MFFFQTLITVVGKLLLLIVFELRLHDCTQILAKILAAQASAQPLKNSCVASAIAGEIVAAQACGAIIAPQVPTSAYGLITTVQGCSHNN